MWLGHPWPGVSAPEAPATVDHALQVRDLCATYLRLGLPKMDALSHEPQVGVVQHQGLTNTDENGRRYGLVAQQVVSHILSHRAHPPAALGRRPAIAWILSAGIA